MYTMSHGDTSMCQIWYAYVIEQRLSCPFKIHGENIILIEAKDQGHTEVMNVHILSHGNTSMYQIWYAYVKEQR